MNVIKKFLNKKNIKVENNQKDFDENNNISNWISEKDYEEGQLSIDVYETPKNIVIKSTIAGVKSNDIDISINNDILTIKGERKTGEKIKEENYLYRECYWGSFSRSIILPGEVKKDKIKANLELGVLTITLPKIKKTKEIEIKIKEKN